MYCVTKLTKGRFKQEKEENGVTLCQILRIFKLKLASFLFILFSPSISEFAGLILFCTCSVVDFFKEMPQFCLKAGYIISGLYGSNWEKRLEVVKQSIHYLFLS